MDKHGLADALREMGKSEREIQQLLDTVSVNVVVPMVVSKVTMPNLRKAQLVASSQKSIQLMRNCLTTFPKVPAPKRWSLSHSRKICRPRHSDGQLVGFDRYLCAHGTAEVAAS